MRLRIVAIFAALAVAGVNARAAGSDSGLNVAGMSADDARRELVGIDQFTTTAAMWIWADKYVYQAGQPFTLRWTVKPNNDQYPYTIVAYRQNNQTGAKTYLPGGSVEAADTSGNGVEQGFLIRRLPAVTKATLAQGTIPAEPGMHTFVVQIRDFTGTRVVKSAYFKIGVVESFVDVSGSIETNTTWTNNRAYRVSGLVFVRNATLTIEPGTFVIGQPGSQPPSAIVITRSARIVAEGTRSRPIIMTSSREFGARAAGDWGGLVMLGRAINNWPNGEGNVEGMPASDDSVYGGTDDAHDCGVLRYVRVEFAGAELSPANEINGITWGSCGTATVAEHLQVTYGLDDAFEWFGGTNNAKYLISTWPRDDSFDGQIGWRGKVQHAVALINGDNSNRGIEMDNNEADFTATPLGRVQFYNLTFVGAGDTFAQSADEGTGVAAIFLRRGAAGAYNNIVAFNWITGAVDIRDAATLTNLTTGDLSANGIIMWDNGKSANRPNTLEGQVVAAALPWFQNSQQARNVLVADPMLRRPLEYSDPDFRPLLGSPVFRANWVQPPDDGFFDQWATWSGAFGDVDWTEEWSNFLQEQDIAP
ncbi:MAG: hypothetical protein KIT09_27515 [Bryobacteraceae bacterium]|nr:hypothetical protein [Bryobacteraceae bacterium]